MDTTEAIIQAALHKFVAPRGSKLISAPGSTRRVATDGERVLILPNGVKVRIHTDASGVATHIEENDALHAIARPHTHRRMLRTQ